MKNRIKLLVKIIYLIFFCLSFIPLVSLLTPYNLMSNIYISDAMTFLLFAIAGISIYIIIYCLNKRRINKSKKTKYFKRD